MRSINMLGQHQFLAPITLPILLMCLLDFNSRYWNGGLFTNSQKYFNATIRIPDALIFIGVQNNVAGQHVAVTEAAKMQVTLTWAQIRYWLYTQQNESRYMQSIDACFL